MDNVDVDMQDEEAPRFVKEKKCEVCGEYQCPCDVVGRLLT